MLGIALALASALTGGVSDYVAGMTSRRIGAMRFLFCTQLAGLVLAGGWVIVSAQRMPNAATLAVAAGAGLGLTVALGAFFQAMVVGTISIVAPISATGVILPVLAGIAGGERLGAAQAAGIVAVMAGIALAARPSQAESAAPTEAGLGLAALAAIGGGLFYWLLAPASDDGVEWAVLTARAVPTVILAVVLWNRRSSLLAVVEPRTASAILASALLAFFSIALYAFATLHDKLAVVAVLGSMFPVVVVLLAYGLNGERVRRLQQVGIASVLTGMALLSA